MTPSTKEEVEAKLADFKAKCDTFLRFGYDRSAAARFVADSGAPFQSPILDVGTGRGLFAIALASLGGKVHSVDADETDKALAEHLAEEAGVAERIVFFSGDAAHLSFPDAHFGVAAMMDVLHHLTAPEAVLGEMARLVKPGGSILLADFDEEGFALLDTINRQEGKEHPRLPVSVDFAARVLLERGFRMKRRSTGYKHEIALLMKEA